MTDKTLKTCLRYLDELIKEGVKVRNHRFTPKRLYYTVNGIEEYVVIEKLVEEYNNLDNK